MLVFQCLSYIVLNHGTFFSPVVSWKLLNPPLETPRAARINACGAGCLAVTIMTCACLGSGFHKWRYPNSWMVDDGQSILIMDDLGLYPNCGNPLHLATLGHTVTSCLLILHNSNSNSSKCMQMPPSQFPDPYASRMQHMMISGPLCFHGLLQDCVCVC